MTLEEQQKFLEEVRPGFYMVVHFADCHHSCKRCRTCTCSPVLWAEMPELVH